MGTSSSIFSNEITQNSVIQCRNFLCFLGGLEEGKGVVDDFCQARKAENTNPRTDYAVKYATVRGRLLYRCDRGALRPGNMCIRAPEWTVSTNKNSTVGQNKLPL